jgi:NADP-reducing hydrogenase subunit HndB
MSKRVGNPGELNALREKAKGEVELRSGPKEMSITVHMGTCGIAAGARDILSALMVELSAAKIDNVTLRHAGCAGLCDQEPMLTLKDKTGTEYRYGKLDKNKIKEIIEGHVKSGKPVDKLLIKA